ncbi:MAG: PAS domain S-box protein, partial [Panacagrimonas sp.]
MILAIVLTSSLVTFALTALDLGRRYEHEMDEVQAVFRQVERVHLKPLSQAAWSTDQRGLQLQVDGIEALPGVEFVAVRDAGRDLVRAGARASDRVIEKSYPLAYAHRGQSIDVGTLALAVDLMPVYRELLEQAASVLAGNAAKTFLVATFALMFFHGLVNRHLLAIARHLRALDFRLPAPELRLERRAARRPDELDVVVGAIGQMERSNREALATLRESEALLRANFDQTAVGIAHISIQRRILRVNRKLEELFGRPASALVDHAFAEFSHPEDAATTAALRDALHRNEIGSAVVEKRYLHADGRTIWMRVTISLSRDASGAPQHEIAVFEDVSAERERNERLAKQQRALSELAKGVVLRGMAADDAIRSLTQMAAEALGVERVSYWRLDAERTAIECADLFERAAHRHSAGARLTATDYPRYFTALQREEPIAAADVHADARTSEFSGGYLEAHGIGAMLDVPVFADGRPAGVLCHEHVGGPRNWQPDEQLFAGAIAGMVALTLESAERLRADWLWIAQAALATSVAWVLARELFDHPRPIFAPVVAFIGV